VVRFAQRVGAYKAHTKRKASLSLSVSLSLSLIKLLLPLVDVNGSEWYTYKPTDDVDVEVQM